MTTVEPVIISLGNVDDDDDDWNACDFDDDEEKLKKNIFYKSFSKNLVSFAVL